MGTLASELRPIAADLTPAPRVYVDANLPVGVVLVMRHELHWDVLFVLEDPDFRRASDHFHFVRALDMGRTLITLDHDFFDRRKFPPDLSPGVIVCTAPNEAGLLKILRYVDRTMLRATSAPDMPLKGQIVEITIDKVQEPERSPRGSMKS